MKLAYLFLTLSISAGLSCGLAQSSADMPRSQTKSSPSIGLVINRLNTEELCLETRSADLKPNDPVTVIGGIFLEPQYTLEGRIIQKLEKRCTTKINGGFGSVDGEFQSFYSLKVKMKAEDGLGLGIAIANPIGAAEVSDGKARIDIDGDGELEYFRHCSGYEGTLLTVWTGIPLQGKQMWHRYFYLGFDTVPDCTEKDNEVAEVENKDNE